MTLKTLFTIPIAVILLVTLSLAGMIVSREWIGHNKGIVAIAATDRAGMLNRLEQKLTEERSGTWDAFEAGYPLPAAAAARLAVIRSETDRQIADLAKSPRPGDTGAPESFLAQIEAGLREARARADAMLKLPRDSRSYDSFIAIMPLLLGPAHQLGPQLAAAASEVIKAEPDLSGIIAVARVGLILRETLDGISAVALPRLLAGQQLTATDRDRIRTLVIEVGATMKTLDATFYVANPSQEMRRLLLGVREARDSIAQLDGMLDGVEAGAEETPQPPWSSRPTALWAKRVNLLRAAIILETEQRVAAQQVSRTGRLRLALVAVGAVGLIILAALAMLQRRVVNPLAHLGVAITRIAGGDRSTKLEANSSTREIAMMVRAVEALRQAALVADATVLRQREITQRRLAVLHEVLGILNTIYEPSHTLERDVEKLSEGIDATIAMAGAPAVALPPTLDAASLALRSGMQGMREAARDLDAAIVDARRAEAEEMPEAEIMARILKVQAHIDRRDALVRSVIQPCLIALRDAGSIVGDRHDDRLHGLIDDQFRLIESTVMTMAAMLAAVTRAAAIVRDLPQDAATAAA